MNDAKILKAIETLHERFMEKPTYGGVSHITRFVGRSKFDVEPPTWDKLFRYVLAVNSSQGAKFSFKSLAHLQTVAEEIF